MNRLGRGGFGVVVRGKSRITGKVRAIKKMQYRHVIARLEGLVIGDDDPVTNEIRLLRSLDHVRVLAPLFTVPTYRLLIKISASNIG